MKHRMRLAAAAFAGALAMGAATSKASDTNQDLMSNFYGAVLDWCETQDGSFSLEFVGAPACEIGNEHWLGLIGFFERDAAWWWHWRNGLADLHLGILWHVGSPYPKQVCAATDGELCWCRAALAALDNPAKLPVVLIGPGAGECSSP